MKAIMYHYVRPDSGGMPYFRYLGLDDFRRQLDHFAATAGFVSKADFLRSLATKTPQSNGVILTFDDGLADHAEHVLPELSKRGLWGLFYVSTGHYATGRMLDVHRIHVLLGYHGGVKILGALKELVTRDMMKAEDVGRFQEITYRLQTNDEATLAVKRVLNYFISYAWRPNVMDQLMVRFFDDGERELIGKHYVTVEQIRDLQRAGMVVGSHSVTHPVFSKLEEPAQREEIVNSFDFLEEATGGLDVRTYCHPYGGFHSFNDTTERILTEQGSLFAFNVELRDISAGDLSRRPQALPRYDCNQFPHGQARFGDSESS
jgi:peptidoglycan/xylan/chitin deacetylase (PgdA/CDA1 family)